MLLQLLAAAYFTLPPGYIRLDYWGWWQRVRLDSDGWVTGVLWVTLVDEFLLQLQAGTGNFFFYVWPLQRGIFLEGIWWCTGPGNDIIDKQAVSWCSAVMGGRITEDDSGFSIRWQLWHYDSTVRENYTPITRKLPLLIYFPWYLYSFFSFLQTTVARHTPFLHRLKSATRLSVNKDEERLFTDQWFIYRLFAVFSLIVSTSVLKY